MSPDPWVGHDCVYVPNVASQERGLDTLTVSDDVEEDRQSDGEESVNAAMRRICGGCAQAIAAKSTVRVDGFIYA